VSALRQFHSRYAGLEFHLGRIEKHEKILERRILRKPLPPDIVEGWAKRYGEPGVRTRLVKPDGPLLKSLPLQARIAIKGTSLLLHHAPDAKEVDSRVLELLRIHGGPYVATLDRRARGRETLQEAIEAELGPGHERTEDKEGGFDYRAKGEVNPGLSLGLIGKTRVQVIARDRELFLRALHRALNLSWESGE
jgi:hypothetical protein